MKLLTEGIGNGVAPINNILPVTGGAKPGSTPGSILPGNSDLLALQSQIQTVSGSLASLVQAMQADGSPPVYVTNWLTDITGGGPSATQQLLTTLSSELDDFMRARADLNTCNSSLTQAQAQLKEVGSSVPAPTQAPGATTATCVTLPVAGAAAVGSALLGGAIGWYARGRGRKGGR
jgi:hypothetical protein